MAAIYPVVGWTFVTSRRRPILRFAADTSPGRHDCLVAACDTARYEQLGAAPGHTSCEESFRAEARTQGIPITFAPQPIKVFASFRVYDGGRLELEECVTKPGDAATFELLMAAIVVLSACPQDIVAPLRRRHENILGVGAERVHGRFELRSSSSRLTRMKSSHTSSLAGISGSSALSKLSVSLNAGVARTIRGTP